jgi:RNA polymerase sigma-70 factor (ECF subfamily)
MPDHADPDAALMLRVQRGDRAAFTELVTKYQQPIYNFILRTLRDETEAEDIAQTAFVQVWKSAARYRPSARFSTWLFTIARNLCLNEIRRRSRHPADSLDAPAITGEEHTVPQIEDAAAAQPTDALLQGELETKLAAALADLPENQRTAILLCQRDELSYEEIAKVLDCSLSATKSLIFRGRETLKQRLKLYLRTGDWSAD